MEPGADSYDNRKHRVDEGNQAKADLNIWREVSENRDVCLGITFMSLKDNKKKVGVFKNPGVPCDGCANEGYWGLFKRDGTPKKVAKELSIRWQKEETVSSSKPASSGETPAGKPALKVSVNSNVGSTEPSAVSADEKRADS